MIHARRAKKLTQEQLANRCDITRAYLANIERGKHAPSLRTAFRIANVLDSTLEQLFSTDRE
ncbi:hypothetical protein CBW65_10005 [Tumebacillus avium]|uniref:HTH cro/C1-type domain-containing protein n=1 Tax=Tumebacillus avium TaxID=1903704 RepID=A0A1Y0ITU3_9BACL|nr:hypothetical protein CBW65_10005 [Tumebacillus avium]